MEKVNIKDINDSNIVSDINLILFNIPENVPTLDKVRWLYIKLGELFSYDYRVASFPEEVSKKLTFEDNYIGSFQTCVQISQIMDIVLNSLGGECKSKTI